MKKSFFFFLLNFFLLFSLCAHAKKLNLNDKTHLYRSLKSAETTLEFDIAIKQARPFTLNPLVLNHENISTGDTLLLDLFSDKEYLSQIQKKTSDVNGITVLAAKLCDFKFAWCFISINSEKVLITIDIPELNEKYCTRFESILSTQCLLQLDESKLDILPDNQISTAQNDSLKNSYLPIAFQNKLINKQETIKPENELKSAVLNSVTNDNVQIDVLIVYTAAAKNWSITNEGGISNTINQAIAKANLAAENSELGITFNLVHSTEVDYEESGDPEINYSYLEGEATHSQIDINNLTQGNIPNVFTIRDIVAADLVILLTKTNDVGGLTWLLNNKAGNEAYGFSLLRVQQASGLTTIHEIGHCLGAHHPKTVLSNPGPTIWTNWPENTWSAGWRWKNDDDIFNCTLMGYDVGSYYPDGNLTVRVPYFSDPNTDIFGKATGDEIDGNNVRTIHETKGIVAAYRNVKQQNTPTVYTLNVNETEMESAISGGCVVNEGEAQVLSRGLVFSESQMPTLDDKVTVEGSGIGSFNSNINGLEINKVYYIRAYATNSFGTSYGNQLVYINTGGDSRDFITRWDLPNGQNKLELILDRSGAVNYTWETIPAGLSGSGTFQKGRGMVEIPNLLAGITIRLSIEPTNLRQFCSFDYLSSLSAIYGPDRENLVDVEQWGTVKWISMDHAFLGCSNLNITAIDLPDLNLVNKMESMFEECNSLNGPENINDWNVSSVTNMKSMFYNANAFDQEIGNWDVSKVTNMNMMFYDASSFNRNVGNWNVSNVTDMFGMFHGASAFNREIGDWDVSKVSTMADMFEGAEAFSGEIGGWNVSNVVDMRLMFSGAEAFNGEIGEWNVSKVINMSSMFSGASDFNQSLDNWNVSNVTDMSWMFAYASSFNQSLNSWDVSSVTDMSHMFFSASMFNHTIASWDVSSVSDMSQMFSSASEYNQEIESWDVSSVTNMQEMFSSAENFNQTIAKWDVSSVTNMQGMFYKAVNFNHFIGDWDVSLVSDMAYMFSYAQAFNQDIGSWNVSSLSNMYNMFFAAGNFNWDLGSWDLLNVIDVSELFDYCGLDCKNYVTTLIGWSLNPNTPNNLILGSIGMYYDVRGIEARVKLIIDKNWKINDDLQKAQPEISGTIHGITSVCQGENSVEYSIDNINEKYNYVWSLPEGATEEIINQSVYVNFDSTAVSGNVSIKAVNECAESEELILYVTVKALPKITGSIIGNTKVCKGQKSVNYSVSEAENAATYVWTLPNGTYGESTTSNIIVDFDSSFVSGNLKVKCVNECSESNEVSQQITVYESPKLTGEIIGKTKVCKEEKSIDYSISEIENATSYIWTLPDGAYGESTDSNITISFDSSFVSGNLKVKGVNACLESDEAILALSVNNIPSKAIAITGEKIVCYGETLVFSCNEIENATSYFWTLPNNETKTSLEPHITIFFDKIVASGELKVKGINSCGESNEVSHSIIVNPLPGMVNGINGLEVVCPGENALLYSCNEIENAESYIWTLPNGKTLNSIIPNISIDIDSGFISGELKVKGINGCGESNEVFLPIFVNSISNKDKELTGPEYVCSEDTSLVYSTQIIENADFYIWSLPNGQTIKSDTNILLVNYDAIAMSGEIGVKGINSCDESNEVFLQVFYNLIPSKAIEINGSETVCKGDINMVYSSNKIDNIESYIWTLPSGESYNSIDSSISIDFNSNINSGVLKVKGINACGTSNEVLLPIQVNPIPKTPQIALVDNKLTSRTEEGNQWYFQGELIEEATDNKFIAKENGEYYVIVTRNGCSSKPSNIINVTYTEIEQLLSEHKVRVYPNPVSNELIIEIRDNSELIKFEIVNTVGKVVFKGNITNKITVETSDFSKGIYFIEFENEPLIEFKKVLKE